MPSEYKYFILILGRRESRRVKKRGLRFVAPKGIVSLLDILTQHHVMFGKEAQKISRKKKKVLIWTVLLLVVFQSTSQHEHRRAVSVQDTPAVLDSLSTQV